MDMQQVIKNLQQIVTEDTYSKRSIKNLVLKDINKSDVNEMYEKCCSAYSDYLRGKYYKSKELRLEKLRTGEVNKTDLIYEVFVAVMLIKTVEPIQNTATAIGNFLEYEDPFDGIKTASELLAIFRNCGLYSVYKPGKMGMYMSIKPKFNLDKDTRKQIDMKKYLMPFVSPPKEVTDNFNNGRFTFKESVVLGNKQKFHVEQLGLDALNKLNSVAFSLDKRMLKEKHESKSKLEGQDKINFEQYKKECTEVQEYLLKEDNQFWFSHSYDFRGRIYCQGYHISYQSTEYNKAILELFNKEIIKEN